MKKYLIVLWYAVCHLPTLRKMVREYADADFIIGHGFPFVVIIPLLRLTGIVPRSMKTVHFQHHRLRRPGKGAFWKWIYRTLLRRFDLIIVDAIPVRNDILGPMPEFADKMFIIGAGLDFAAARRVASLPPEAGMVRNIVAERKRRIIGIYAARFVPHKNHNIFLGLLKELHAQQLDEKFLLILTGDEILGSDFEKAVMEHGFSGMVRFTGSLPHDEVFRATKLSDVCLFPSLEEGFGLSILEALALGVPTLAFRDAIPEELHPFLMLADDENDFIKKAFDLIAHSGAIQEAATALKEKEREVEYFDINAVLRRLYDRLCEISVLGNEGRK